MGKNEFDGRVVKCRDCYRAMKQEHCDLKTETGTYLVAGCLDGVDINIILECLAAKADQCQTNADATRARLHGAYVISGSSLPAVLAYIEMQEARARAFEAEAEALACQYKVTLRNCQDLPGQVAQLFFYFIALLIKV